MSDNGGPKPVRLHPNLAPEQAHAARESWQQPIRDSYRYGPPVSAEEARVRYVVKAVDAAAQLRAKGLIEHESLEAWAREEVETSQGTMTRLRAFLGLDTAEDVYNDTYDALVASDRSESEE